MKTQLKPDKTILKIRKGGTGISILNDWGIVEVSGTDAINFMQARTSNDVLALQSGQGQLSSILDRSAKIQALFSIHRQDKTLWLLCEKAQIPHLISELEKYRILEHVSFTERSEDFRLITLQGVDSSFFLEKAFQVKSEPKENKSFEALEAYGVLPFVSFPSQASVSYVFQRSLTGEHGYILALPRSLAKSQEEAILQIAKKENQALIDLSHANINTLRIEAGIPRFGKELDSTTLLPETGLEQSAVSYTKGCYLGQETIARVKTYGAVQKALVGLVFSRDTTLPPLNSPCIIDGKTVGQIKSTAFSPTLRAPVAMAYLGKDFRRPKQKLTISFNPETPEETCEATVSLLPFYTSTQAKRKAEASLASGLLDFAEGRDQEAISKLRSALAFDATLADAYEALGVILSRQDEFEEAIALTEKLAELEPDKIMAHTNLSVYYMKIGDKDRAEEEKAKATVLGMRQAAKKAGLSMGSENPEDLEAQKKKREEATRQRIQLFKNALANSPNDPLGNFGLGSAHLEINEYAEAIEAFLKVIDAQGDNSSAFLSLGKAYEGIENTEKAIETYEKGIEVAAKKRDLMPLKTMEQRLETLKSL